MTWTPIASGGLPSASSYTDGAFTDLVIDDCESATGWTSVNGSSLATTTSFFTTGTHSVQCTVRSDGVGATAQFYKNLAADQTTSGRDRLLLDFNDAATSGALLGAGSIWTLKVADAVNLTGNVLSVRIPRGLPYNQWFTIVADLGALTKIRSFGIYADAGLHDTVTGAAHNIRFDNIRLASLSKLDVAYDATTNTVVPASYTSAATQAKRNPASRAEIDLRPGKEHIGRLGGVRHIREWASIAEDGLTECSTELNAAFDEAGLTGTALQLPAGAYYWVDHQILLDGVNDLEIDGQGATLFCRTMRGGDNNVHDDIIQLRSCRRVTIRNLRLFGYVEKTNLGSALTNDGGTPTVVSTTKTLTSSGDTVRQTNEQGIVPFYARYPLISYPSAVRTLIAAYDSTFVLGNAFTANLSDTNQIAGDCILELVDTVDASVLASRTLTLTSSPTDYVISYQPADIHRNFKVRVRKATATANTITVTNLVEYGRVQYIGTRDSADGIHITSSRDITIEDVTVEGAMTDALDVTDVNASDIDVRGFTSRAACRQGVSFNRGQRFRFLDFSISETGRSGIDVEPFNYDWRMDTLEIGDGQITNVTNYALACNNWAGIKNLHLHDVYWNGCGVQGMLGGARGALIADVGGTARNSIITPTGTTVSFNGQDMKVRGVVCDANVSVGDNTNLVTDDTVGIAGFVAATVDTTADTLTVTNNDFYVINGDQVFVRSVAQPSPLGNTHYFVVGAPAYASTFQVSSTLGGTAINITTAGTTVTVARVVAATPQDNDVEAKLIGDFNGILGTVGRGNQLRVQPQATISSLLQTTTFAGVNLPVENSGTYEINKQTLWPRSHGRRLASEVATVIGGYDLNGQGLTGVRGIGSDQRVTVAILASAARTTTATTSSTDLVARGHNGRLTVVCTASSGTTRALNINVEVSQDNTNFYTAASLRTITGTQQVSLPLRNLERYLRLTYTITGNSPSFTFSATLDHEPRAANNLAGRLTLGNGVTTGTVVFPTAPIYPKISTATPTAVIGGTLAAATYYYRCGGRTRRAGPQVWDIERSVVVGGSNNAVRLRTARWHEQVGVFTEGLTVLRGTAAGVYDMRYDLLPVPNIQLFQTRHDLSDWTDLGTSVTTDANNNVAFPTTYETLSGPYAAVDESGWEPSTTYRVTVTPSWLTTIAATTRRRDGFDLSFGTATPDANQFVDWMVVR